MPEGEMWQRFTTPATRVIFFAQEEAKRLGTSVVGTEHMLLGLIREGDGVAAHVLVRQGLSLGSVRSELARQVGIPEGPVVGSHRLTLSPKAKTALECALKEARELNQKLGQHDFVDTEHLLLGLIRDGSSSDSKAVRLLEGLGVDLGNLREDVLALLSAQSAANFSEEEVDHADVEEHPSAPLTAEILTDIYDYAYLLALRIFEASKTFPADEATAFSAELRRVSRMVCLQIATAPALLHQDEAFIAQLEDVRRSVIAAKVLLEFAAGYGYLAKLLADEMRDQYDQLLTTLGTRPS